MRVPVHGADGHVVPDRQRRHEHRAPVDFDSGELGYGIPGITAAKNLISWDLDLTGYSAGEIVTYYCRIHPFMRGAIEVTE